MPRTSIVIVMLILMLGLATLVLATSQSEQPREGKPASGIAQLAWLAGMWVMENPGVRSEEHWMTPRGGSMIGMNRTVSKPHKEHEEPERTRFFEFLRIEEDAEGIVYLASPKGRQSPTPFKMIEITENKVVFENPDHDFPQRVMYERAGEKLTARIEGTRNGENHHQQWTWTRENNS
jgi:hypothetical protein